ncbi:MAG: hypothetical protein GY881_02935 [Gammaproteobacteria bacterium]|nr:hypothetical protein [Gammaproteobacteria bacterium]
MGDISRFNSKTIITAAGTRRLLVAAVAMDFNDAGDVTIPEGANYVEIRAEKADATTTTTIARFISDGVGNPGTGVPTASDGVPIANLDFLIFGPDQIKNLQMISADANTQKMWLTWYKV